MTQYLTPDTIRKISVHGETLAINVKIIPNGSRKADGSRFKPEALLGGDGKPRGITVHNTGAISVSSQTNMAEQYARACYPNGNLRTVAVHFWVWHDIIWQQLDESERGWHATDGSKRKTGQRIGQKIGGNMDTISIECIGKDAESEATTAKLVAYLCKKYNLDPAYDIYQHHYFYAKKSCPEYIAPHWGEFLTSIAKYMVGVKEDEEVKKSIQIEVDGVVRTLTAIESGGENYLRLVDLRQAGYNVQYDSVAKMPILFAPDTRKVPPRTSTVATAATKVQSKATLDTDTIAYLERYTYGDKLLQKLADSMGEE